MSDRRTIYRSGGDVMVEGINLGEPFRVRIDTENKEAVFLDTEDIYDPSPSSRARQMQVGTVFQNIIKRKYGTEGCESCIEMVRCMNAIGTAGSIRQKELILNEIWERRDQVKGWRKMAAALPGARFPAMMILSKMFDEAVLLTQEGSDGKS